MLQPLKWLREPGPPAEELGLLDRTVYDDTLLSAIFGTSLVRDGLKPSSRDTDFQLANDLAQEHRRHPKLTKASGHQLS